MRACREVVLTGIGCGGGCVCGAGAESDWSRDGSNGAGRDEAGAPAADGAGRIDETGALDRGGGAA